MIDHLDWIWEHLSIPFLFVSRTLVLLSVSGMTHEFFNECVNQSKFEHLHRHTCTSLLSTLSCCCCFFFSSICFTSWRATVRLFALYGNVLSILCTFFYSFQWYSFFRILLKIDKIDFLLRSQFNAWSITAGKKLKQHLFLYCVQRVYSKGIERIRIKSLNSIEKLRKKTSSGLSWTEASLRKYQNNLKAKKNE